MNAYYEMLLDFFDKNSKDANSFINCEVFPFDEDLTHKDKYFDCLKMPDDQIDTLVVQVAQTLFASFYKLLKVAMKDQLPGGLFYVASPELSAETLSVIPHNKLPERAFGMLDFMVRFRPNASILTNESFITLSFNKTHEWLDSLPKEARDKLLTDARKQGRVLRGKFKLRCSEIKKKRLESLKKKQEAVRKKKENSFKKKEKQTSEVIFYGLWQSSSVADDILRSITKTSEKRKALIAQLRFRQNVLKQYVKDKKIFNASVKGKALSIEALTENVKKLIEEAASKDVSENIQQRSSRMPILVGKKVPHTFNEGTFTAKVISTVPGFPDYYNLIHDN
ncbi:unnamed protein product [Mytilus coruscus]|uniref:Uncharacterized protein n=1 Tax=Mytilus coruscus TaxID=42192 RepID=A0A6J8CQP5_MYTCO|nr:unnamed protein product [Mytilus coruscus]